MDPSTWSTREESRFKDRAGWGSGAWDTEPDRVEWRWLGPPRLPCLIVRGPSGALCGYVGVPPGHPDFGAETWDRTEHLSVHGGITYYAPCAEDGHICHVAKPGEADGVWWLGFDCAHGCDIRPGDAALYGERVSDFREPFASYKSVAYVRAEVESLARQLCRVAKGQPPQEAP